MNKYDSKFSPGKKIRSDQYIIELICYNRANFMKVELPIKFWDSPEWASFFKSQLRKCQSLLKKYDEHTIIKVVSSKRIWNLHTKWIEEALQKAQSSQPIISDNDIEINKVENSTGRKHNSKNLDFLN